MPAYYNEIDPYAAQWLRNLIAAGHIAPGVVDTRSIEDVTPADLRDFGQVHMFAGIGGWSLALRLAGWPDDRPVWTGSCPCQPFSAAGKGAGLADERHLWPAFYHLIEQCRPAVVFGEQVASKAVDTWIDLVHADLESVGYTFGSIPFPSASVGAPHIRDRNYWVAHANGWKFEGLAVMRGNERDRPNARWPQGCGCASACGDTCRLADSNSSGRARLLGQGGTGVGRGGDDERAQSGLGPSGEACGVADADIIAGGQGRALDGRRNQGGDAQPRPGSGGGGVSHGGRPGPTNGLWRDADWLACRDGKWRPVEPGTFPLAHGIPGRVGRLRAYGNAINPYQAAEFIGAYLDVAQG